MLKVRKAIPFMFNWLPDEAFDVDVSDMLKQPTDGDDMSQPIVISPENKLRAALFFRAVLDCFRPSLSVYISKKDGNPQESARAWIYSDSEDSCFSFVSICEEVLKIPPGEMRKKLELAAAAGTIVPFRNCHSAETPRAVTTARWRQKQKAGA